MIVINFKTYPEVTSGTKALDLARIAEEVSLQTHVPVIICVQATDIYKLANTVSIPIFAQHIDTIEPGKHTGFISVLAVKENGASGVMINHSEHRIGDDAIRETMQIAKNYNLHTLLCVENAMEAKRLISTMPDMVALEEPSLIGTGNSIVDNPLGKQKVQECISFNLPTKLLVGAGVMDRHDVQASLELKAAGVLIASGYDLADNPKDVLTDLCKGFNV